MPPIIIALLAGAGLYVGYKMLSKPAKQTQDHSKRRATGSRQQKNLGELEIDPKTGEYRPKQKT